MKRSSQPIHSDNRGFALLELLVALIVVSMTMVAMAGIGQMALHTRTVLYNATVQESSVEAAGRLFTELVEAALSAGPNSSSAPTFVGSDDGMTFWTLAPLVVGADAPVKVSFKSRIKNSPGLQLVVGEAAAQPDTGKSTSIRVNGDVTFLYLPSATARSGTVWQRTWSPSVELPAAAQMIIQPTDRKNPFVFVARPHADVPLACALSSLNNPRCG